MAYAALVTCSSEYGRRGLGQTAVAVVLAVDAQRAEGCGQALDLAQEVGCGEPALAELARECVGGGGQRDPGVHQFAEQGGDEYGVARVVQFELVDAQQPVAAQGLHGLLEAERADQVRQLDEGAEGLELRARPGWRARGRRAGGSCRRRNRRPGRPRGARPDAAGFPSAEPALAARRRSACAPPSPAAKALEHPHRLGLAGLVRVRNVRIEADRVEARRRHHLGDQPVGGDMRLAGAQGLGDHSRLWTTTQFLSLDRPHVSHGLKGTRAPCHTAWHATPVPCDRPDSAASGSRGSDAFPRCHRHEWSTDELASAYAYPAGPH